MGYLRRFDLQTYLLVFIRLALSPNETIYSLAAKGGIASMLIKAGRYPSSNRSEESCAATYRNIWNHNSRQKRKVTLLIGIATESPEGRYI